MCHPSAVSVPKEELLKNTLALTGALVSAWVTFPVIVPFCARVIGVLQALGNNTARQSFLGIDFALAFPFLSVFAVI